MPNTSRDINFLVNLSSQWMQNWDYYPQTEKFHPQSIQSLNCLCPKTNLTKPYKQVWHVYLSAKKTKLYKIWTFEKYHIAKKSFQRTVLYHVSSLPVLTKYCESLVPLNKYISPEQKEKINFSNFCAYTHTLSRKLKRNHFEQNDDGRFWHSDAGVGLRGAPSLPALASRGRGVCHSWGKKPFFKQFFYILLKEYFTDTWIHQI